MLFDPETLLPIAYRAASQVVHSPILAEEASERAVYQLTMACLEGSPPDSPRAWLRTVAKRAACAILRSEWARTKAMDLDGVADCTRPAGSSPPQQREWVREHLAPTLTPRQREAFEAAITHNTTRAAARSCTMEPRDFRRSIAAISRRGRQLLERQPLPCERQLPGAEAGVAV